MSTGRVEAIFVGPKKGQAMQAVDQVEAADGLGLKGDRFARLGDSDPGHQLTLIEAEAIEALLREYEVPLEPAETRRNIVTRGVALNHLVGREFRVGPVRLRGVRLCEPCGHLERLTRRGVRAGLVHRGGLRAQILGGGTIRVGDPVEVGAEG
ncbi:MAG: MOSC domain-containing protein [Isosphaeraceae bacterium]